MNCDDSCNIHKAGKYHKKSLIDLDNTYVLQVERLKHLLQRLFDVLYVMKLSAEALSSKGATVFLLKAIIDVLIAKLQFTDNDVYFIRRISKEPG